MRTLLFSLLALAFSFFALMQSLCAHRQSEMNALASKRRAATQERIEILEERVRVLERQAAFERLRSIVSNHKMEIVEHGPVSVWGVDDAENCGECWMVSKKLLEGK